MIKDRNTRIGYHCPYCGLSILNDINIFSMYGNMIKLKCVCGASELIVQTMRDNKYKITVPCILCPNSHSYTLSSTTFFEKDLFSFTCKFTAINICFIGKYGKVHEALKNNEEELMETFAAFEEEYGGENNYDENIFLDNNNNDYYFNKFDKENDINNHYGDYDYFNEFGFLDDYADDDEDDDYDDYDGIFTTGEKEPEFVLYKNENYNPDPDPDYDDPEEYDDYGIESNEPGEIGNHEEPRSEQNPSGKRSAFNIGSYQIVSQILDNILKLHTKKKIFCKCGYFDGKLNILENAIHLECQNCGAERNIRSMTISDAEYISGVEKLYLDFDD